MTSLYSRRYSRRSTLSLAGLAAIAPILAACSSKSGDSPDPASSGTGAAGEGSSSAPSTSSVPTGIPDGMGSGQGDDVFPRTVTHFQGSTEITQAPTRVVITGTGQLDIALTLGFVPVGSTAGDGAELIPSYLAEAFPQDADALAAMRNAGNRKAPDIESIAESSPDLILMNNSGKDAASLYTSLSEIAATVVTQGKGTNWKQDFLLMADALGKPDTAQTWLDSFHTDAAKAGESIDRQATVSLLRVTEGRLRVFGTISFAGSVLADMGAARPEGQQFTDDVSQDISKEELDKADGGWLLYGVQGGDASELTSLDLWPALQAVSADHAVQVDDDPFFLNAGPTAARTVLTKVSETVKK
ncbi:ABC transporter substrate-binding protein [Actinomyces massiliensis]|uniref:ABC transporter substrate-binding protein n=1 Tax=Actinomyces massiliensis TaxID=461393 RepID=UPI0028E663CE|nr:ABC transporter substrate-binding protein [Actinomyces massiliensis]